MINKKEKKTKYFVDKKICAGCGGCIYACPYNAIQLDNDNKVIIDQEKCQSCGKCLLVCPFDAIKKSKN